MTNYRAVVLSALLIALGLFLVSCTNSPVLSSIQVSPTTGSVPGGATVQYKATGTYTNGPHPPKTQDITDSVTWASSSTAIATVTSSGLATGVNSGTTTITATMSSSLGAVTGSGILNVAAVAPPVPHELTSIATIPATQILNTAGETAQFIAIGTFASSPTTENLAGMVTWTSSDTSVASVNSSGQATAVGCASSSTGCVATITASGTALDGSIVTGSATLTVSPGTTILARSLSAITIIPGAGTQTVNALGETAQFIAIGTYTASPTTQDITDLVTWQSSDVDVATINPQGLSTAVACTVPPAPCITTITASAPLGANGSYISSTSNLSVDPGAGGSPLPSLAVYTVGSGSGGTVVSSPVGITCSAGQGCTGFFTSGSSVTLTASPASSFGGWSANCTPVTATTCTVKMTGNQTVGAIFN